MENSSNTVKFQDAEKGTNAAITKVESDGESKKTSQDNLAIKNESHDDVSMEFSSASTVVERPKPDKDFVFYKCRFCGLTFNYMTTLKAHERVHNIDQPYKCNRCSEAFHFMCELEYHAKQHSDQTGFKCECGRTFHTYTDLLYHKHPGEEDEVVGGEQTTESVPSRSGINEEDFSAPDFVIKGFEPKHPLKVYSDVRLRPYICQYCSKSYADSRSLAYHMYGHRGERSFNPRASRYLMSRSEQSYISPGI